MLLRMLLLQPLLIIFIIIIVRMINTIVKKINPKLIKSMIILNSDVIYILLTLTLSMLSIDVIN